MGSKFTDDFKFGLGAGLGFAVINLLSFLLGMVFFIPGLLALISERKKPVTDKNKANIMKSYFLMFMGSGNSSMLLTHAADDL